MAVINLNHKWLFLCEPHTASRAVMRLLCEQCGGSKIGHHHIDTVELVDWRRGHLAEKQLAELEVFCSVRNPFDVLVTRWKFGPFRDVPFHKFVKSNAEHHVVNHPLQGLWKQATNFVYFEDMSDDLSWLFGQRLEVPRKQSEATPDKQPWYTYYEGQEEISLFLLDKYGDFLDQFGYRVVYNGTLELVDIDKAVRKIRTQPIFRQKNP